MEWNDVLNNPVFQNLPFKIELNRFGQIVMSERTNQHGLIKASVANGLGRRKEKGAIILGCSIQTSDGVKVADVAWASDEFIAEHGLETPYEKAPEICVEVTSPSNSKQEMEQKVELYLARGAHEVWLVNLDGEIKYYSHTGMIKKSAIVPKFKL